MYNEKSAALKRAKREAYFQHVHHTTAIEGNTMTLLQTRHVLETRMAVAGKSVMEHNEILGLDAALRFLDHNLVHRVGFLTLEDILNIHRRVLGFVDPVEAGIFRKTQVYVGDFAPVAPSLVPAEMRELVDWMNSEATLGLHPVELAALAHYKLVFIHPFIDGNGRTSRLLMNLFLMQAGFPPVIIRVDDRLEYYDALKMANDGDLRPFIRFIARCTDRTLDEYLAQTTPEIPVQPSSAGSNITTSSPKTTSTRGGSTGKEPGHARLPRNAHENTGSVIEQAESAASTCRSDGGSKRIEGDNAESSTKTTTDPKSHPVDASPESLEEDFWYSSAELSSDNSGGDSPTSSVLSEESLTFESGAVPAA